MGFGGGSGTLFHPGMSLIQFHRAKYNVVKLPDSVIGAE